MNLPIHPQSFKEIVITTWFKNALIGTLLASSPICADNGIHEVRTMEAPQALGPYSQAVRAGQSLFI